MDNIERLGIELDYLISIFDEVAEYRFTVEMNEYDLMLFHFYSILMNKFYFKIFYSDEILNQFINFHTELKNNFDKHNDDTYNNYIDIKKCIVSIHKLLSDTKININLKN